MSDCPTKGCTATYCVALAGEDRGHCVERGWNGTEEIRVCVYCASLTWHRSGNCLRCVALGKPEEERDTRLDYKPVAMERMTARAERLEAERDAARAEVERLKAVLLDCRRIVVDACRARTRDWWTLAGALLASIDEVTKSRVE